VVDLRNGLTAEESDRKKGPIPSSNPVVRVWRRLKTLGAKLIVPYVVLTLITAMVGIFVVTRLVTSSVQERFRNQIYKASGVAADGLVRVEREHLAELRLMAFTEGVPEAFSAGDVERLRKLLWPLVLNESVEVVSAVDLQGEELVSLARDPASGEYAYLPTSDLSGVTIVSNVIEGHVDSFGDKYAGIYDISVGPTLFTSAPVRDSGGKLVGVLLAGSRLETVLNDLSTQALADIWVLGSEGNLLASTLPEPVEGYEVLEMDPGDARGIEDSLRREFDLNQRPFQAVLSPLVIRRQTMGVLGVALPSNYIVDTEATSRNWFAVVFSIGTTAVIVVGYLLARSIIDPILRLREVSQAVASGDLTQSTGIQADDEIGELAVAFDSMTLRLRERTEEAARLYAETVQRNTELAEINTRLQQTQAQLIQSEKLAAIGELTAGIVHDVKNPLAVIKGLAEELMDSNGGEEAQFLMTIRDNAARANVIVTDLLKFARQSDAVMEERDLRDTITACLRLTEYMARKSGVEVIVDLPSEPVYATYDASQMEQVLINLVQNAVQAMGGGGALRIILSTADEVAAIAVQDEGVGISEENLRRIFDPFFTTKAAKDGTGLGLSVSYGIVSNHGGTIEVESEVGVGSTFTVLLPLHQGDKE
jgi:two-component system NtrC family sensor kinase